MKLICRAMLASTFVLVLSSTALAQATRTWVSGTGNDVNPCSRTAPCKTFAGAYLKTAAGGIISVLDPGGYGGLTIGKSLTVDGGGIEGSGLVGTSPGITVNGAGIDVTIRNISLYGVTSATYGIRVLAASKVTVENVTIQSFNTGIDVNAVTQVNVKNTLISRSVNYGVYFRQGKGSFDNVHFENSGIDGLRVGSGGVVTVRNSVVAGSGNIAFSATEASTAKLMVEDCTVTNNAWGIGASMGAAVWVSATTVTHQTTQGLWTDGGTATLVSFGNNRLANNLTPGAFTSTIALQ
jgi:hypothetical protein